MKITMITKLKKNTPCLIIPLFEDEKFSVTGPEDLKSLLKKREKEKDFKAKAGEHMQLITDDSPLTKKIILFGFGKKEKLDAVKVRNQAAGMQKDAVHHKQQDITLFVPEVLTKYGQELAEGLALANYNKALYKTEKSNKKVQVKTIKSLQILTKKTSKKLDIDLKKGLEIAGAVNDTRNLVNGPNNFINPETMSEQARKMAKKYGCKVTVFGKKQLTKMKFGGLLAVNRGSEKEAKLVVFEYKPPKSNKNQPIVIVGKGVTFDSGGYNLKPSHAMDDMKTDMAGAATIFGVFQLLKTLKIKHHVIGITPLTENLIGSKAQTVKDVITMYSGKTVEITNTDAEGRLILADAVAYAAKKYKPRYMIDLATLTGACIVALGDRYAGLLGNNEELIEKLKKTGEETDESVWQMPLDDNHSKKMKSVIADLQNAEGSGLAGTSKGAAFIKEFVGKTAWAHLDIAGVAYLKDPKPYDHKGATGYGVRLIVKFLERLK
jgi:leucyl aminopeptidase